MFDEDDMIAAFEWGFYRTHDNAVDFLKEYHENKLEQENKRIAREIYAIELEKFRNNLVTYDIIKSNENRFDYLRINIDKIETSQHIFIDINEFSELCDYIDMQQLNRKCQKFDIEHECILGKVTFVGPYHVCIGEHLFFNGEIENCKKLLKQ